MKVIAFADQKQLESVDLSMKITMNMAQWRVVGEALKKGKDGYYGAAQHLLDAIDTAVDNFQKVVDGEKTIKP